MALFTIYDADKSGALDYKEFSEAVFGAPKGSRPGSVMSQGRSMEQLAQVLKDKLASRGARGIIGLQKQFKIMDDDNSKSLNMAEFNKAMTDY